MTKRKIYTAYDPPPAKPKSAFGQTLTRQSEADASNINNIMRKYIKSGVLPPLNQGFYADVSVIDDYRTAIDRVNEATQYFYKLPADIRDEFDHDASMFLDYISDPKNYDEIQQRGWIAAEVPPPEPQPELPLDKTPEEAPQSSDDAP